MEEQNIEQAPVQEEMRYVFQFTKAGMNLLLQGLGELPTKMTIDMVLAINQEMRNQEQAAKAKEEQSCEAPSCKAPKTKASKK